MNEYKLLLGIILVVLSGLYLIYTIRSGMKDKNYSWMTYSYDVKIVVGTLAFFVIGIILIYRGFKNI